MFLESWCIVCVFFDLFLLQFDCLFDYVFFVEFGEVDCGVCVCVLLCMVGWVIDGYIVDIDIEDDVDCFLFEVESVVLFVFVFLECLYIFVWWVVDWVVGLVLDVFWFVIFKCQVCVEKVWIVDVFVVVFFVDVFVVVVEIIGMYDGLDEVFDEGGCVVVEVILQFFDDVFGWMCLFGVMVVCMFVVGKLLIFVVLDYCDLDCLFVVFVLFVLVEVIVWYDFCQMNLDCYCVFLCIFEDVLCIVVGNWFVVYVFVCVGLVVIWDDGDLLFGELFVLYVYVCDVVFVCWEFEGLVLLFVGYICMIEVECLVEIGWLCDVRVVCCIFLCVLLSILQEMEQLIVQCMLFLVFFVVCNVVVEGFVFIQVFCFGFVFFLVCVECWVLVWCVYCGGLLGVCYCGVVFVCGWCGCGVSFWFCFVCFFMKVCFVLLGSECIVDELGWVFFGVCVIVVDGVYFVECVGGKFVFVVVIRGVELIVEGGYCVVVLFDGFCML